ncbi:MAG TPA: hypothetical protein VKV26_09260 [Dehalococcoidia bacterium]|nr:hypothetical protein [Dehalococcoidia bacterium]
MNEHGTSTDNDSHDGDAAAEVQGYATGLLPYTTTIDAQRYLWLATEIARPLPSLTQPSSSQSSFSNEPSPSPRHIPT